MYQLQLYSNSNLTGRFNLATYGKICNISDYGAIGDNVTDNTHFIQSAINDRNTSSNIILVSKQWKYYSNNIETVYLTGSIFLNQSNSIFKIDEHVRLAAINIRIDTRMLNHDTQKGNLKQLNNDSISINSYPMTYTRIEGVMGYKHAGLINTIECEANKIDKINNLCLEWSTIENISIIGISNQTSIIDGNINQTNIIKITNDQIYCQ